MGESKSQQNLSYGQSVIEPDFNKVYDQRLIDQAIVPEADPCEMGCDRGWLPVPEVVIGFPAALACPCNVDVRGLAV